MTAKNILKLLVLYSTFLVAGTIIFIGLFHTGLFGNIKVLFYRGIILLIITSFLTALLQYVFKQKTHTGLFTYRDLVLCCVIVFSFNLIFFTHVPVTADRSISIFMLGYMNNNADKIITNEEMTKYFIEKYVQEYKGMDKRFTEQIASGNIIPLENGYRITKQGQIVIKIYSLIAKLFVIDSKNISP